MSRASCLGFLPRSCPRSCLDPANILLGRAARFGSQPVRRAGCALYCLPTGPRPSNHRRWPQKSNQPAAHGTTPAASHATLGWSPLRPRVNYVHGRGPRTLTPPLINSQPPKPLVRRQGPTKPMVNHRGPDANPDGDRSKHIGTSRVHRSREDEVIGQPLLFGG